MSMNARFVAITPAQLSGLQDRPETVGTVFALEASLPAEIPSLAQERIRLRAPQLVADMIRRMPPDMRERMRRRLGLNENYLPAPGTRSLLLMQLAQREAARQRRPSPPGARRPARHVVSLAKAWHGVHYLLCGRREPAPEPLGQAVCGGSEIGANNGYGPARWLDPEAVGGIAAALGQSGLEAAMRARFDTAEMTRLGIYPGGWEAEDRAWLIKNFRALRKFYAAAGKAEHAVVTVIE